MYDFRVAARLLASKQHILVFNHVKFLSSTLPARSSCSLPPAQASELAALFETVSAVALVPESRCGRMLLLPSSSCNKLALRFTNTFAAQSSCLLLQYAPPCAPHVLLLRMLLADGST